MTQFGWKAATEQFPPSDLIDYAVLAEHAGFDSLDASDHFHPWSEAGQASFVWTVLGAMAVRTTRISLGPGLTSPILRYHPSIIAQAAATLACLAPGRVYLAIGTGEALNDYAATGQWPSYRERQRRLAEALELMRLLWQGDEVTFQGDYYQTRKAKLYTRPSAPIPVYISSLAPASAAFAGEHGDGLLTVGGQEPGLYREMVQHFEEGARRAGRDPSSMPRLIELRVEYTNDADRALAEIKRYWAGAFVPALFSERIYTPAQSEKNGRVVGRDVILQQTCISADPEQHVRHALQYLDLGFTHLYFHTSSLEQQAFLEGYGRDVLPKLRQQAVQRQPKAA